MSFLQIKQMKCELGFPHKISKQAEKELYQSSEQKIHTYCQNCNVSLTLEIDQKNPNYYIITIT